LAKIKLAEPSMRAYAKFHNTWNFQTTDAILRNTWNFQKLQ